MLFEKNHLLNYIGGSVGLGEQDKGINKKRKTTRRYRQQHGDY